MILPEVGAGGQQRLAAARVLVIGAGGLGCPALQYLAGAGIGTLGIVDHDSVDVSNLHRQTLYRTADAGRPKAQAAREALLQLNPGITVNAHAAALTEQNALGLFSGYDIVVDGTDNFAAKFLINDAAAKAGRAVVYGAIQGFDGQVAVFDAARGPCYRCLYPQPPESPVMNCAEAGVIGAVAGIVGTVQAMEVIKLILNDPSFSLLAGRLWMVDARTMESRSIKIPKNKSCAICARPPAEIVLTTASPVCFAAAAQEIDCAALAALKDAVVIDVRELPEWEAGHIAGARHLPLSVLQRNLDAFMPAPGKTCVLYCQRGARSGRAAEMLLGAGHRDIFSLRGGYEAWQARG